MYSFTHLPLFDSWLAHAESPAPSIHAPSHHEPIARLKDVQGAGHPRVGHRAHKDGKLFRLTDTDSEEGVRKNFNNLIN